MAYYDRYRGSRRRRQNRIKIILLVLLLLVVLGLAALFLLQETAIFTSDGFRFPFGQQEQSEKPSDADSDDDFQLEIQDPQPKPDVPAEPVPPQQQPEPELPAELPQTAALRADGMALLNDKVDLMRRISEGGLSQVALVVKTPDGISLVDDDDVSDGVSDQAAVFALELDSLEVGKIAVISALRDNVRPRTAHRSSALHLESGSTWLDREYISWFDPAGPDTLSCLLATIRACEAAGFSQVVLENFSYPTAGKLELIDYGDAAARIESLTALAKALRENTDMPLALVLTEEAAADLTDGTAGQDVAALAPYFDVLYAPAAGFDADVSVLDTAVEGSDCRIGLLLDHTELSPADFARDYLCQ